MTLNQTKQTITPCKISPKGYVALCQFEGLRCKAYKCAANKWTIGYGHTNGVVEGMVINRQQAVQFLDEDLQTVYNELKSINNLTSGMFDALCDFIFNVGVGNWRKSQLRKMVIANSTDAKIGNEFKKWRLCNGKVLQGLVTRRAWEAKRYYEID